MSEFAQILGIRFIFLKGQNTRFRMSAFGLKTVKDSNGNFTLMKLSVSACRLDKTKSGKFYWKIINVQSTKDVSEAEIS